jgi:hypothetical protein
MPMANTVMKNSRGPYVLAEVKIFANLTIRFLIQRGMHAIFGFFPNTSTEPCRREKCLRLVRLALAPEGFEVNKCEGVGGWARLQEASEDFSETSLNGTLT